MKEQEIIITNMSCFVCQDRIRKALLSLEGVKSADVSLVKGRALVLYDDSVLNRSHLVEAVNGAGYSVSADNEDASLEGRSLNEDKKDRISLAVSFLLTLFIILISAYPEILSKLMLSHRLSLYLQLLSATAVAFLNRRFFISACKAFRHGTSNMDTLVSLGSLSAFVYSLFSLFGTDDPAMTSAASGCRVYFESAAGILTFVSVGKYLEKRCRKKMTSAIDSLYSLAPEKVLLKTADGYREVMPEDIKTGDIIVAKQGQRLGADGVVEQGHAFVDESTLNGESRPKEAVRGTFVYSSSLVTDGYIEIKTVSSGDETAFGRIIKAVEKASLQKPKAARIADTVSAYFVPFVIVLSLLAFTYWYFVSGLSVPESLGFAVSVLVISCPCALGIATPCAIVAACYKGADSSIIFKSPEAIEILSYAKHFVFDKTGTLTTGNFRVKKTVVYDSAYSEDDVLSLCASLEKKSSHLIARAIMESASGLKIYEAENYSFIPLKGVRAEINGRSYALFNESSISDLKKEDLRLLNASGFNEDGLTLYLTVSGHLIASVLLSDEPRDDSRELFELLSKAKVKTSIVSGDSMNAVKKLSKMLGADGCSSHQSPLEKADLIKRLKDAGECVVMTGDGVNDSVALKEADIGISMKGASDIAVSACDVILLNQNALGDVYSAYYLAKRTMRIIKQNLFFALFYNALFIPVAAGVFYVPFGISLNPVICSCLMGMSSVCVVMNALRICSMKLPKKDGLSCLRKEDDASGDDRVGCKSFCEYTVFIEGMMCSHCESSVRKVLNSEEGLEVISVSHKEGKAVIKALNLPDFDRIRHLIESEGYRAGEIRRD